MKHSFIFLFSTALLFFSCSKSNVNVENSGDVVALSVEVLTKSAVINTANIDEFTVFGSRQGSSLWGEISTSATMDLMYDVQVTKDADIWTYGIPVKWDNGLNHRHAFFGYSPRASADNKISLITNSSSTGYQKLSYETLQDVTEQIDLVVSSHINQVPVKMLNMSFTHALTRVGFSAFTNLPGTKIRSIYVKGVKYKGDVSIYRDVLWSNVSADTTHFYVQMNPSISVSNKESEPTDLTGSGRYYFMLLPQDFTSNVNDEISVMFNYTQGGVDITQSYILNENWAAGKSLKYVANLSGAVTGDLLIDEVVISDWVFGAAEDYNFSDAEVEIDSYTIKYNANGGSGCPADQKVEGGASAIVGARPTGFKSQHLFTSYNTEADGSGDSYNVGDQITSDYLIVLYAQWVKPVLDISALPSGALPATANTYRVTLPTYGYTWRASSMSTGIYSREISNENGILTVDFEISQNTGSSKVFSVLFEALDGARTLSQFTWSGSQEEVLRIDATEPGEIISGDGNSYVVNVTYNGAWTVAPSEYLTASPTRGTGAQAVTLTVASNPDFTATRAVSANFSVGSTVMATWSGTQDKGVDRRRIAGYITVADDGTGLPAGMKCVGMYGGHNGSNAYTKALYIDKKGSSTAGVNSGDVDDVELQWGPNNVFVTADHPYQGLANTNKAVALGTQYAAANYCKNKGMYLPAYNQFDETYNATYQLFDADYAVMTNSIYHCSNEAPDISKTRVITLRGYGFTALDIVGKLTITYVRCVAEF